jgi:hypothetical protein
MKIELNSGYYWRKKEGDNSKKGIRKCRGRYRMKIELNSGYYWRK